MYLLLEGLLHERDSANQQALLWLIVTYSFEESESQPVFVNTSIRLIQDFMAKKNAEWAPETQITAFNALAALVPLYTKMTEVERVCSDFLE